MFYEPGKTASGLPHDPFKAIVAPRPIGWISTVDPEGRVNLAPYSFFNAVGDRPPLVMFSSSGAKHSIANVAATNEFVCNLATWDLREAMNETSAAVPRDVNEFDLAGLTMAPSRLVRPPRVAECPAALECRALHMLRPVDLDGRTTDSHIVVGQVVGIHVDEAYIRDGRFDMTLARTLARCGYMDYAVTDALFVMDRPR
jgi:flavin reductase (DIM6/NTAB) family NADH-FMN oxidoreductase RutF